MRENNKYSFLEYLGDIWHYISPYKRMFFLAVFLRLTSDVARLYPVWGLSQIVLILSGKSVSAAAGEIYTILTFFGITSIYHAITHNSSKYFGYQVAEKAALDIYNETLSHVFKLDLSWQEKENSGNKMKRIDRGSDGVQLSIRRIFNVIIEVFVNLIGVLWIFLSVQPILSFSLLFFILTYVLLGTHLLKRAIRQERIVNKVFENLSGLTFESLNNIHTIKSLAIDEGVLKLVRRITASLMQKLKLRIYYYQSQTGILLTYQAVYGFATMAVLVNGILSKRIEISLLVLFMGLFQRVTQSATELTEVIQEISLAKVRLSRAKQILSTTPVIENPEILKKQVNYPLGWKEINIKNIKFSYKNLITLDGVTLSIKRGEKVGIVGLSGAGKSTLFKLMLDLYENYTGSIEIDGIPLKRIKRQSYIEHVAVVLQDTELFDMSFGENIKIAAVGKSDKENKLLNKVIEMAHLTDVVSSLPRGVNTIVGEKGIKLSGGQRQRVGIARALFREPDILLLDEATSHLDAHSEKEIQNALSGFLDKYTTIVIAHRLSTIMAMDKIVVLEKGKVVEVGTFGDLVKAGGVFAKMWQEQKI